MGLAVKMHRLSQILEQLVTADTQQIQIGEM